MTEEQKPSAIDLFLTADKKIDEVRSRAEHLMAEDLELKHKMDLVIQRQDQLKERFEHTSSTGHKTWEMVQNIAASVEKLVSRQTVVENKADAAAALAEKIDKRFDKVVLGIFITVFCSVILCVMGFLWNFRAPHP